MSDILQVTQPGDPRDKPSDGPAASEQQVPSAPVPRSAAVRDRLRRQKTRDTAPELALRRQLHALGLRYRVDHPVLPGRRRRPDIVFTRARVAVFVDGCFWHRCPQHATMPKNNADWWAAKLQANADRDLETDQQLRDAGWLVARVWEHEPAVQAAERINVLVAGRRPGRAGTRRMSSRS